MTVFLTNLTDENTETVKGGIVIVITNTRPTGPCGGCDIASNTCGGATSAGPGSGNTGWPPSVGCSNNSFAVCHAV